MQIKILRFLLCVLSVILTNVSYAGISDWFASNCKQVKDLNGLSERQNDIKATPEFKNAKFYSGLCADKSVPDGKQYCVKMFHDSQVHDMAQAIHIAKDYALQQNNDIITCHSDYWSCYDTDDHILCSTSDNSAHYEFIFDDIVEKDDAKYKKGIAKAYCKMFFGEQSTLEKKEERNFGSLGTKMETVSANDKLVCYAPDNYKSDFIYDTCSELGKKMEESFGYYSVPDKYSCEINFRTVNCSNLINNLPEIDNSFKTLQLDLDNSTIMWLAGYVQSHTDNPINSFKCDLAAHTCNTGDIKNPHDDILTCYADDKRIDFIFDDLSETKERWIKASEDAKECINAEGVFDGRRCQGITQEKCTEMKSKGIDVDWDKNLKACSLKTANTVATINRITEVAATVGVATAVATATVATGGGASVVIIFAAGMTAAGSQTMIQIERNKTDLFISDLLACKTTQQQTERDCVRDKFIWFIDHGSNYMNNLTAAQIDAIDKAVAKKMSAIDINSKDGADLIKTFENSKDKDVFDRCTGDALQTTKCMFDVATIVLDFLPVTGATLKAPEALGALTTKIGTKMPNTAKVLFTLSKSSAKIMDKIDTANDIYSATQGITYNALKQ